jgi:hypothetical protein
VAEHFKAGEIRHKGQTPFRLDADLYEIKMSDLVRHDSFDEMIECMDKYSFQFKQKS